MKIPYLKIISLLIILIAAGVPTTIVIANSPPPPYRVFIQFVNENSKPVPVTGLQITGCADETCQLPEYLIGYGNCTGKECYAGPSKLSNLWVLNCAGNQCLLEGKYNFSKELPVFLQMLVSTADETWMTNALLTPDCSCCDTGIKVVLLPSTAFAVFDEEFESPSEKSIASLSISFFVTVFTEGCICMLFFFFWRRKFPLSWKKLTWSMVLANIISYPIAWLTIPSLGQFQADSMRKLGLLAVSISIVIAVISLGIRLAPVFAIIVLVLAIISVYGNQEIHSQGLSPATVIIASELFAVVFETFYIHQFLKNELTIKQVATLCLAMNAISAALGYLVF